MSAYSEASFSDQREVIRIALAEAKKALRNSRVNIEVYDFIPCWYGSIVVVKVKGAVTALVVRTWKQRLSEKKTKHNRN